jgi:hypothetical protein
MTKINKTDCANVSFGGKFCVKGLVVASPNFQYPKIPRFKNKNVCSETPTLRTPFKKQFDNRKSNNKKKKNFFVLWVEFRYEKENRMRSEI